MRLLSFKIAVSQLNFNTHFKPKIESLAFLIIDVKSTDLFSTVLSLRKHFYTILLLFNL